MRASKELRAKSVRQQSPVAQQAPVA